MNYSYTQLCLFFILVILVISSCEKISPPNLITPEDDITIGETLDKHILGHIDVSNTISYLSPNTYLSSYSYANSIRNNITNSSNSTGITSMPDASVCTTELRIIDEPGNSNAFVVPGGYIYLYKDFLQKIKTEAQFIAVLSHLMACSQKRMSILKLEDRFSESFLIDLALGGDLDVDISLILTELEEVPYDSLQVQDLDIEAENTVCELGYDIKSYSDLFNDVVSKDLLWYDLFPRSRTEYASHLYNVVKNNPPCDSAELDKEPEYLNFKNSLDL
jgi:hypothetical protein